MKNEWPLLGSLAFLMIGFSFFGTDFMSSDTWENIFQVSTELGFLALAATLLMASGEFDLSMGSFFALSGMVFAQIVVNGGYSPFFALGILVVMSFCMGVINSSLTLKLKMPSFLATLGTMLIVRGIVLVVTNGFPITLIDENTFVSFFNTELIAPVKMTHFLYFLAFLGVYYILHIHPKGNWIFASGGNTEVARTLGLRPHKTKTFLFILAALLTSVSGVVQFVHLETFTPTSGEQYELRAIAAAVIGGASLSGGRASVFGTFLGTLLLSMLATGLTQAGISTYWLRVFTGMILLLAVVTNSKIQKLTHQKLRTA